MRPNVEGLALCLERNVLGESVRNSMCTDLGARNDGMREECE